MKDDGVHCDYDCECASGWCYSGDVCKSKLGLGESCRVNEECASGSCDNRDCGWRGNHCGSFVCVPVMGENGDFCTLDYQCKSNYCSYGYCEEYTSDRGQPPDASDPYIPMGTYTTNNQQLPHSAHGPDDGNV
jgi:hypothetical protein